MSVDITVVRGGGDIVGEDIVDHLIINDDVAIQRGRREIDASTEMTPVTLQTRWRAGLETGQTAKVLDVLSGATWYGRIASVDISVEGPVVSATLEVEKI